MDHQMSRKKREFIPRKWMGDYYLKTWMAERVYELNKGVFTGYTAYVGEMTIWI
jgi:hypothetical protein